jgi:hypothetical protein
MALSPSFQNGMKGCLLASFGLLVLWTSESIAVAVFCVCRDCGYVRDTREAASRESVDIQGLSMWGKRKRQRGFYTVLWFSLWWSIEVGSSESWMVSIRRFYRTCGMECSKQARLPVTRPRWRFPPASPGYSRQVGAGVSDDGYDAIPSALPATIRQPRAKARRENGQRHRSQI